MIWYIWPPTSFLWVNQNCPEKNMPNPKLISIFGIAGTIKPHLFILAQKIHIGKYYGFFLLPQLAIFTGKYVDHIVWSLERKKSRYYMHNLPEILFCSFCVWTGLIGQGPDDDWGVVLVPRDHLPNTPLVGRQRLRQHVLWPANDKTSFWNFKGNLHF